MPIITKTITAHLPEYPSTTFTVKRAALYVDDQVYPADTIYTATSDLNGLVTFTLPVPDNATLAAEYMIKLPPTSDNGWKRFSLAQGSPADVATILQTTLAAQDWDAVQQLFVDLDARMDVIEAQTGTAAATATTRGTVLINGTPTDAANPVTYVREQTDALLAGKLGTAHEADTTAVHGIADTAALILNTDARLTDARTPTAHATTHASAGTDPVTPAAIGALATTARGAANGVASLGASGTHPLTEMGTNPDALVLGPRDFVNGEGRWVRRDTLVLPEQTALPAATADAAVLFATDVAGVDSVRLLSPNGLVADLLRDDSIVVENRTAATITKGMAVYISGVSTASFGLPAMRLVQVAPARSDSVTTMPCIGLALEDIPVNSQGRVMTEGMIDGLNTSAWAGGVRVYVSKITAGALTDVPVAPPEVDQLVGIVVRSHLTEGQILVVTQTAIDAGIANGYAMLDGTSKLIPYQIPFGTAANTVTVGNDARLSDARTPTAHAASHASGGTDAITPAAIGALATTAGAVGTANIADGAVTAAKVAADVATQAELDAVAAAKASTDHNATHEVGGSDPFTGIVPASAFAPSGLTGAVAASRYVGATASGAPTTGTFAVGDYIIAQNGTIWICTTAGTPGTWTQVAGSSGMADPMTTAGDLIRRSGTNVTERLAVGANGQVLTVVSGLPAWAAGGSGALTRIAETVLTAAAASVDFTSIPATYTTLLLTVVARYDAAVTDGHMSVRFNTDATAVYDYQEFVAFGTSTGVAGSAGQTSLRAGVANGASAPAGTFGHNVIHIPAYSATTVQKHLLSQASNRIGTTASDTRARTYAGGWRSTAAINQITILPPAGSFVANSIFRLYGIS